MTGDRISVSLSPRKSEFGPLLFSGNLEAGLRAANSFGYTGVELSLLDSLQIDREWLLKNLAELNLSVYAIATGQTYYEDGFSLYNAEEHKRQKCVQRLLHHIDLAELLKSMVIIGGVRGTIKGTGDAYSVQDREGRECLRTCAEYAAKKNVVLLLEPINRYETNVVNTLGEGVALIAQIGLSNVKLLPDTFHMNIEEADFERAFLAAAASIGYVHFADSNRLAPGWGHINFAQIMGVLKKIAYRGPIGIEVLPKPDDASAAKQAVTYLKENLVNAAI
jgi:sugar phosphate isomerase/epimerase